MHGGDVRPVEERGGQLDEPGLDDGRAGRWARRAGPPGVAGRVALAALPVVGLAVVVAVLWLVDPIRALTGTSPTGSVAVERTVLQPGRIELHVRNDGRTSVTVAQLQVNDAYWHFTTDDPDLGRLDGATVVANYPWEPGVPLRIALVTSTGTVIDHEVANPSATPRLDAHTLRVLGLAGLLIAPLPVALGVCWLPTLRRSSPRALDAVMAFTVGLLAFLVVDSAAEGIEAAGEAGRAVDGIGLFTVGALVSFVAVAAAGRASSRPAASDADRASVPPDRSGPGGRAPARRVASSPGADGQLAAGRIMTPDPGSRRTTGAGPGLRLALLVAVGLGLHNLGEGLAVGTAITTGEVALGTALVVAFAVHNLTEGVAIAGPLGGSVAAGRAAAPLLAGLVAVAGLPVLAGLWLGGFVLPAGWAALAFGLAAGAIAEVLWAVGRWLHGRGASLTPLTAGAFATAVLVMYVTGVAAA